MTPPCARCHGAPYTSPGTASSHCEAEARWAGEGSMPPPDRQALESWVRSNFERAREQPRPFRIDLDAAHLRAEIRLAPQLRQFGAFPWGGSPYRAVAINTAGARIGADWEVADNALMLGLRELLSIDGITIDGPMSFNAWPESLRVGNFGQVHLISRATNSALFLADPFMVPRPPLGEDLPTARQWEACEARNAGDGIDAGLESCTTPVVYPNHREDPRFDHILNSLLPAEFLDADGRLPVNYNLETLLANFAAYRRNHPPNPSAPSRDLLALVEEWLSPGSHIDLEVERLNDFFIPGILDLGPSRGNFRVTYLGHRRFSAVATDFEIQLDPSGYPASTDGERSPVEVETAILTTGSAPVVLDSLEVAPGLRLEFDAASGELWVEANVHFQSDMRVPLLNAVEVSGDLSLRGGFRQRDGAWQPLPGSTHVRLSNAEIYSAETGLPLLADFELDLSDVNDPLDPLAPDNSEGFRLRTQGRVGSSGSFDAELTLPIAREVSGSYDLAGLMQTVPAQLAFNYYGDETYQASLSLLAPPAAEGHREILAELNVHRGRGEERRTMIENAELRVDLHRASDWEDGVGLSLDAGRFTGFGVDLHQPNIRIDVERLRHQDGITEVRVPRFSLRGNPHGSRAGLLRGPFGIELHPSRSGEALSVIWNSDDRRLDFRNLDLRFNLQGIDLPPLHSANFRRLVDRRVATIGLDGRLDGSLHAELPLDRSHWRARGAISLRGDRDGDIYFLDSAGRRVGAPLIRDTRWRFDRVDRVNWRRRYALGRFHLDTMINFSSFLPPAAIVAEEDPVYGLRGQRLRPYEINGVMPYDNQPWDLRGFRNRIVDYLTTLCERDAACREGRR